ncbi:MAG TPA: hypothetical protein ENG59_05285 [Chloroflexi bacterium]|nr:MAG: hypothetical protein DRI46_08595 [Chloroflexota bacterium]HDD55633.1 hypothetical protein [Chloroflexota bacterium]
MIIVRNERLIKRNKKIGNYSGIISIIVLGAGMYVSFKFQDQFSYALAALVVGFTLSQVGIFYSNRFARSPRPDEELDAALKGLDDQYALYHYQSPVTHLLVGPAGLWVLYPFPQKGKIVYNENKGRWKKIGGNLYLQFFAQDSIGRPDQEIERSQQRLKKALEKIPEFEVPEIRSALVFSDEKAVVEAENAPVPTLHARQLKKLIRKEAKGEANLPTPVVKTVQDYLGLESIT